MNSDKELDEILDEYSPVEHADGDYQTCNSLYYECTFKAKKVSKYTRQRANGIICLTRHYYSNKNMKECPHPAEFYKPGKCNCGAIKEHTKAKQRLNALIEKKVREGELRRLKQYRLAWSADLPFEPLGSLNFQIRELQDNQTKDNK